ncbi:MAG: hypothetical protein HYX50_02350 [Chloroflexi bacterium]|nr:hypothetical protein [Chloroflexota bacterium]
MRRWSILTATAVVAIILAAGISAAAYALMGSDGPSPTTVAPTPAPAGGGAVVSAVCAPGVACDDMIVVPPDQEGTCEEANACAQDQPCLPEACTGNPCPPVTEGLVCKLNPPACTPEGVCTAPPPCGALTTGCYRDPNTPMPYVCEPATNAEGQSCFVPPPCIVPLPAGPPTEATPPAGAPGMDDGNATTPACAPPPACLIPVPLSPGQPAPQDSAATPVVCKPISGCRVAPGQPIAPVPESGPGSSQPCYPPGCVVSSDGQVACPDVPPSGEGGGSAPGSTGSADSATAVAVSPSPGAAR